MQGAHGRCDLLFETQYTASPHALPTPLLRIHIIGGECNIESFGKFALNTMAGYVHAIALATNAASEDVRPRFFADVTPERRDRRFLQFSSEFNHVAVPTETRLIDPSAALAFYEAVHSQEESKRDRLVRALQQYVFALRYWTPTTRAMAVVHAFMGAEALVDVAKRSTGLDDNALAEKHKEECGLKWLRRTGDVRNLAGAFARRHVIFHGDIVAYNAGKRISDGFEHGYGDYDKLGTLAEHHAAAIMDHVRKAIIELSGVDGPHRATLLEERSINPIVRYRSIRVGGTIAGSPKDSNPLPLLPLQLEAASRVSAVSYDAFTGAYNVSIDAQIEAKVDDVTVESVTVWPEPLTTSS